MQGGYTQSNATNIGANWIPSSQVPAERPLRLQVRERQGQLLRQGRHAVPASPRRPRLGLAGVPAQFPAAGRLSRTSPTPSRRCTTGWRVTTSTSTARSSPTWAVRTTPSRSATRLNRISDDVQSDFTQGNFQVFWNEDFDRPPVVQNARGPYGYYIWQDGVRLNSAVNSRNQGFYVQDTWQVSTATDGQRRRPLRERVPAAVPCGAGRRGHRQADRVRLGRQDRAARRRGVGRARQRQVEAELELHAHQRRAEVRAGARLVRRRLLVEPRLSRSTIRTSIELRSRSRNPAAAGRASRCTTTARCSINARARSRASTRTSSRWRTTPST